MVGRHSTAHYDHEIHWPERYRKVHSCLTISHLAGLSPRLILVLVEIRLACSTMMERCLSLGVINEARCKECLAHTISTYAASTAEIDELVQGDIVEFAIQHCRSDWETTSWLAELASCPHWQTL